MSAGHRGDQAEVARHLHDPEPAVRAAAVGALWRLDGSSPALLSMARDDPDAAVRRRACEEIGRALGVEPRTDDTAPDRQTDVATALTVLREALRDPDDAVVEAAAWATGEAGASARQSVPALAEVASAHRSALCREAAVAALGAVGHPSGLDAVLEALEDKPAVRRRAAAALAAFSDPRAEAGLHRCLEDRDWQVRQAAEDLLG